MIDAEMPEERITVIIDEPEALGYALNKAKPGDLLLVFGDAITRCWKQIVTFKPEQTDEMTTMEPSSPALQASCESFGIAMDQFESLIIDERGARLAREEND